MVDEKTQMENQDIVLTDNPEPEKKGITKFRQLVKAFIDTSYGRKHIVGHYRITEDGTALEYRGSGRNAGEGIDILAIRLPDGRIIGNASMLPRCGSYSRGDEAPAQMVMFEENIAMIPFNVFEEAGLDLLKAEVIEQGKEEDFMLPRLIWDSARSRLRPEGIVFTGDDSEAEPHSTKDRKIKNKWKCQIYVNERYKNGNLKYKKTSYGRRTISKRVAGWSHTYYDLKKLTPRHFVGAMVLKVDKKYFLFDVDRQELKHYNFNPFLSELPKKVTSIKEAYELLKPKEVKLALKRKLKVRRQGEWFFIPCPKDFEIKMKLLPKNIQQGLDKRPEKRRYDLKDISCDGDGTLIDIKESDTDYELRKILPKYRPAILRRVRDYNKECRKYQVFRKKKIEFDKKWRTFMNGGVLQAKDNRGHSVSKLSILNGVTYATGEVKHGGREHAPIKLAGWHIAVPNTAIKSFTITGNID